MQITDLLPGTMRRISRARSIVSGVELWHPAKTTTRKPRCFCALHHHDRMLMSSCHIAFEHRHHLAFVRIKLFSGKPNLFSKCPVFIQTQNPGLRIILFCLLLVCKSLFEINKIFNYFSGAVERADPTQSTTPSTTPIGPT